MPTKSAIIKSPPFTVTFCDQVIQYEGQTFINNSDYSNRKDIKFTIKKMEYKTQLNAYEKQYLFPYFIQNNDLNLDFQLYVE